MAKAKQHRLVAIGGGGGVSQVILGARPYFEELTAVVAVTDTGRSTGVARLIGDIPAPGDLRSTLANLAPDPEALWPKLLQHRFHTQLLPELDGMAFGNLLIAALTQLTGDFAQALALTAELVGQTAQVLPVSTANTQLCAELADGQIVEQEFAVRGLQKAPIKRLFLAASTAQAYPPVLAAIEAADLVVLGPGSLFTSVLASLLFHGIVGALQQTKAQVVFVCNTTTQPGQTDGFSLLEHLRQMVAMLGPGTLDYALINHSPELPAPLIAAYAQEGLILLQPKAAELAQIAAWGVKPIVADFVEVTANKRILWAKADTLRHQPALVGQTLWQILVAQNGETEADCVHK